MSEKLFNNVFYNPRKTVRAEFCPHTINTTLPHALEVGATFVCVECLIEKLNEAMYRNPDTTYRMWCATCKQFRQTQEGICLTCGGRDLRD